MSMQGKNRPVVILLAEDNPADQEITRRVLGDAETRNDLYIVKDGVEAMDYLLRNNQFSDKKSSPRPDLILLDINMPRMDGKSVLEKVKSNPNLKTIPVVMLTTSEHQRDVLDSYARGVNAYITKPVDIGQFVDVVAKLEGFWLRTVEFPGDER